MKLIEFCKVWLMKIWNWIIKLFKGKEEESMIEYTIRKIETSSPPLNESDIHIYRETRVNGLFVNYS